MFNMQLGAQDFRCAKKNNKMAVALNIYLAVSVTGYVERLWRLDETRFTHNVYNTALR